MTAKEPTNIKSLIVIEWIEIERRILIKLIDRATIYIIAPILARSTQLKGTLHLHFHLHLKKNCFVIS